MATETSFVTRDNGAYHVTRFKKQSIVTVNNDNNRQKWKHDMNSIMKADDEEDEEGYFTQIRNSLFSTHNTSAFSNSKMLYNSSKRPNCYRNNKQQLHQNKKRSKIFYIDYDDIDSNHGINNGLADDDVVTNDSIVSSVFLESSQSYDASIVEKGKEEEEDYCNSSSYSSSDDEYFDPLPTPTNAITTTTTPTALSENNVSIKEDLLSMTRFGPVFSIESSNIKTTPSTLNTSLCSSPAQLLRRCDTKREKGLDQWFASKLLD